MPAKKTQTYEPEIYSETIVDSYLWLRIAICILCIVCVLVMAGFDAYFMYVGNIEILIYLLSVVGILYFLHFSKLKISATTSAIAVRYGLFRRVVPWEDIIDCYTEIVDYYTGGVKSRFLEATFPVMRSKRKLIYHRGMKSLGLGLMRYSRSKKERQHVVLRLRRGGIEEFSFSTRKPKALVGVIKGQIGKQVTQENVV